MFETCMHYLISTMRSFYVVGLLNIDADNYSHIVASDCKVWA